MFVRVLLCDNLVGNTVCFIFTSVKLHLIEALFRDWPVLSTHWSIFRAWDGSKKSLAISEMSCWVVWMPHVFTGLPRGFPYGCLPSPKI